MQNNYGNIKATVMFEEQTRIKLESLALKKPINIKANFDPQKHMEKVINAEQMNSYVIVSSKLAKFNKTLLNIVNFGAASYIFEDPEDLGTEVRNSNAKQMISVD